MNEELYKRQKDLGLKVPKSVAIIGVGGVGSWVAINMALVGVEKIIIADYDDIEEHNLNRTLFTYYQIGDKKVEAIAELIGERRPDAEVIVIDKPITDHDERLGEAELVIDARDNMTPLPFPVDIKLTYDGPQIAILIKPHELPPAFGEDGYTTVPSYLVPPQLLASLVTDLVLKKGVEGIKAMRPQVIITSTDEILRKMGFDI